MAAVPDNVKRLLEKHPALQLIEGGKKVRCSLTGHEIPSREGIIKLHLDGKKYQRQLKLQQFDYDQYKPHIVPSEKKWNKVREQLFCKLTLRHLNRDPSHVQKYVSGKRYKSALARWEECQRTGQPYHPRGGSRHAREGMESESDDDDEDDDDDDTQSATKKKPTKIKKKGAGKEGSWKDLENMMEKDDGDESSDSLADLYPAEDFEVDKSSEDEAAQSGSDSEFEDDEEIPEPTNKTQKAGQKRKGAANTPSNTKQKPQKKKQKLNPAEVKKQNQKKGANQKQNLSEENKQRLNPNEGNKKKQKKQKKKTKKLNSSVTLSI